MTCCVVQKLAPDPEVNDDSVGFHAQQAVEKALKVALTLNGIDFPKTHDLDFLLALANRNEIELPVEMAQVGWLTPWAAEFRYDDAPIESLDRKRAEAIGEFAVDWCCELLPETAA